MQKSKAKRKSGNAIKAKKSARQINPLDAIHNEDMEAMIERSSLTGAVLDHIPQRVFVKDRQSAFVYCNQRHAQDLGVTSEEIVGKNDFDFYPDELADKYRADDARIMQTGVMEHIRETNRIDGRDIIVDVVKVPLKNPESIVVGLVGIFWDITEKVQAEAALRYERDMMITLLDQTPDVIFFQDITGRFTKVSRSMAAAFDASPDTLIGKTVYDFMSKESADQKSADDQQVIASGKPIINRIENFGHFHGRARWTSTTKVPWSNPDGQIIGLIGIARDISDIKEKEDELHTLTRVIEQCPVSVMIIDTDGVVEYVNPMFTQMTDYSPDEACGRNFRMLKSGLMTPEEYHILWETITTGHEWRGQLRSRKKNGELYWEYAIIAPVRNAAGVITHFVAVKEDVTERKRMEQMLLQSEKMASIGTLTAGIVHEINNPIGYIQGNLGVLESHQKKIIACITGISDMIRTVLSDTPVQCDAVLEQVEAIKATCKLDFLVQDSLDAIQESLDGVRRVSTIIADLKDFARSEDKKSHFTLSNVQEGLEKTLHVVWNELKYKADVKKEYGTLPLVECDQPRLNQVFLNLLVNAAQAMHERGVITLTTRQAGDTAIIEISDTGVGIPLADQEKIFDAFYTTKAPGEGTGLGLSIASRIIQDHQGALTVDSAPGKGTTFRIVLPLRQKLPVASDHILLVEDDDAMMTVLKQCLQHIYPSPVIRTAHDGFAAAQVLHDFHPDLAVLDYWLPGMNGLEVCRRIRRMPSLAATKILFITGCGDSEISIREQAEAAGADAFLQKPFSQDDLAETIRKLRPPSVAAARPAS